VRGSRAPGRRRRRGIDRDQPIGIAIEREARIGTRGRDRPGQRRRCRRARLDVDVDAVGVGVDDVDTRTGRTQDLRTHRGARPVRGIEHEVQAAGVDRRCQPAPMVDVCGEAIARIDHPADLAVGGAGELLAPPDQLLDLLLDRIVKFEAVAVEDLEAVVRGRVMRGGDHDPGRE
jgi:hypothetical protein